MELISSSNRESSDDNSALATAPGLSWRPFQPTDAVAIAALATMCLAADGGLSLGTADTYVQEHYLPARPGASIGAFEMDGRLIACAAVQPTHTPQAYRTTIVGMVHPAFRGHGVGAFLLRWSTVESTRLLSTYPPDRPRVLQLTTESLTEAAARLFQRHMFTQQHAEDVMRRDLGSPLPDVLPAPGIRLATWAKALADQFFDVYSAAFRERPGFPNWSQEEWIAWLGTENNDFRPELSLLAFQDDLPVGFIVCADRWIIQVGVRPEWRAQGIGSALVIEALRRFQAAGGDHVLLDVNVNNPRAARVYTRLGFEQVGRRARFVRVLA